MPILRPVYVYRRLASSTTTHPLVVIILIPCSMDCSRVLVATRPATVAPRALASAVVRLGMKPHRKLVALLKVGSFPDHFFSQHPPTSLFQVKWSHSGLAKHYSPQSSFLVSRLLVMSWPLKWQSSAQITPPSAFHSADIQISLRQNKLIQ